MITGINNYQTVKGAKFSLINSSLRYQHLSTFKMIKLLLDQIMFMTDFEKIGDHLNYPAKLMTKFVRALHEK